MSKWIVGFGSVPQEYVINGVKYVVESKFQKVNHKEPKENILLNDCVENYLLNDFADLTEESHMDKMIAEYVCSGCMTSDDVREED